MNSLKIADSHNDLLMGVLHQKERGISDPFGSFWLPQLRNGGVALQVLPIFTEDQFVGEGSLRRSLLMIETAWNIAAEHSADVEICLSKGDITKAMDSGKIALVLALEGAEPFGSNIEFFDIFFKLGIRMLSLTWNRRTMHADGVGEQDTGGKLTQLGIEAISEMERLGIILDVSHISENGFWNIAQIAKKSFIASHSSCRALQDHPRNLTDLQFSEIANKDGFVGINAIGAFLSETPSIDSYLDHVDYALKQIGPNRVGFGFDFIKDLVTQVDPILGGSLDKSAIPLVPGLVRPSDLAAFSVVLIDRFGVEVANNVGWRNLRDKLESLLPSTA